MPVVQGKKGVEERVLKNEPRFDKTLSEPGKYEISKDSVFTIEIGLVKNKKTGWWEIVTPDDKNTERVVIRMWTFDEMVEMRKMATKYDQLRRSHVIDFDILNRLKLQKLLVSWTFGKDNQRLNIHHVNGVLTDESWNAITKLQTNILRFIINKMNEYLEAD